MTLSSTLPRSNQQRFCGPLFASQTHPGTWCVLCAIVARPEPALLHSCFVICKCRTVSFCRATFRCASQSDFPLRSAERRPRALRRSNVLCVHRATFPCAPQSDVPVRSAQRLSRALRRAKFLCAPTSNMPVRTAEQPSCVLDRATCACPYLT